MLHWHDTDEIGYQLSQKFPDDDPLAIRFTDLRKRIMELDGFGDDPAASTEGILEAIQMAWLEYFRDRA